MSDARSLLRAHRAANRVEHPHAAYSDAGKLLCKICRELIKSDSLWDTHARSTSHRQRTAALQAPAPSIETANKRKHDDVDAMDIELGENAEEALPKKRNRTASVANGEREASGTPPGLTRRTSSTPAQGIEISIPSRPATPQVGEGSQTSTPNLLPLGRSPLTGPGADVTSTLLTVASATQLPISTESLTVPLLTAMAPVTNGDGSVDEAEWAAFEAEVAAADQPAPTGYADTVISAAALTAEDVAAKSREEEGERRKHLLDVEIADEKEDATRALEDEFDEMEQLESRVRKLKERREELRKGSIANLRGAAAESDIDKTVKAALGKENDVTANGDELESEEEEDDEDWDDGFRFRGA